MKVRLKASVATWNEAAGITAFWMTNLLCRMGHEVAVEIPAKPIVVAGLPAATVQASIEVVLAAFPPKAIDHEVMDVSISPFQAHGELNVWSHGWTAMVGQEASFPQGSTSPLAAALAGALGVATLHGLHHGFTTSGLSVDIIDVLGAADAEHQRRPQIQGATLAGFGAVGSAYGLAMAHLQPHGTIRVLDPEVLDAGNCIRYVCAYPSQQGTAKATVAEFLLQGAGIEAVGIQADATTAITTPPELLVCAVHEAEIRRQLASTMARVVLDAAVGPGMVKPWSARVELATAGPLPDARCLACIYHEVPSRDRMAVLAKSLGSSRQELNASLKDGRITSSTLAIGRRGGISLGVDEGTPIDLLLDAFCGSGPAPDPSGAVVLPERIFGPAVAGVLLAAMHVLNVRTQGWTLRWDILYQPTVHHVFHGQRMLECVWCGIGVVQQRQYETWATSQNAA